MVFASQYWEIDISTIGDDEPAPVCTPNDQDICTFSNILAFDISTPLAPTKLGETALPRALTDLEYWPNDKNLYLLDTAGVMVAFVDENPPYLSALSLTRMVTYNPFVRRRQPKTISLSLSISTMDDFSSFITAPSRR